MEEFTCDHPYFVKKCSMCMNELKSMIKDAGYVKWGPYKNKQ